jgi:hypothetical protein
MGHALAAARESPWSSCVAENVACKLPARSTTVPDRSFPVVLAAAETRNATPLVPLVRSTVNHDVREPTDHDPAPVTTTVEIEPPATSNRPMPWDNSRADGLAWVIVKADDALPDANTTWPDRAKVVVFAATTTESVEPFTPDRGLTVIQDG